MRLLNQRAFITGAASGIGAAIATAFAAEGARVVIFDINAAAAEALARQLREEGREAIAVTGSVSNSADIERAFAQADAEFGSIDILINNAGVNAIVPTLELSDAAWDEVLNVNLRGAFLCARAAGTRMVRRRSGVILNISSIYGIVAAPQRLAYCTSKSAVAMMAKVLATEWSPYGIRVNALAPGYVQTPAITDMTASGALSQERLIARTPLGRLAEPAEIAEVAVYICSASAAYITGQVIGVDGGWTAYGYV
ncbi:MAG TPA: glucose 1-dehydrogenase [Steroidobacter sp.]